MRDTRGNRGKSKPVRNNERKRGGRGQLEAVFPPHSLLGSGVTRNLAMFLTPNAAENEPKHSSSPCFPASFSRSRRKIHVLVVRPCGIFFSSQKTSFLCHQGSCLLYLCSKCAPSRKSSSFMRLRLTFDPRLLEEQHNCVCFHYQKLKPTAI